jgi:hypothetical protein
MHLTVVKWIQRLNSVCIVLIKFSSIVTDAFEISLLDLFDVFFIISAVTIIDCFHMGVWTWSFGHVVPNFIIFLLEIILACITRIDALMITLELIDLLIDNSFIQLNILILCIELRIHLLNEITINILCWKICKIPI